MKTKLTSSEKRDIIRRVAETTAPHKTLYPGKEFDLVEHPQQGEPTSVAHFDSGAKRSNDVDHIRMDLICPTALQRLGRIYAEGTHYDDGPGSFNNWCKGMPINVIMNHMENHYARWKANDSTEDHLAKLVWGAIAIMHFEGCCQHHMRQLRNDDIYTTYKKMVEEQLGPR